MKEIFFPIMTGILLVTLAGCSLLPSDVSPKATSTPSIPPSSYEPQPEDARLQSDQVFLDLENSSLVIRESMPVQVSVILNGSLSDPCHKLRVAVKPADEQHEIKLQVYSVYDPSEVCITMIQPFTATIPLGSFSGGHYTVFANGQLLGEFDA